MRNSASRNPANFIDSKRLPVKKTPTISVTTARAVRYPKSRSEAATNLSRLPGSGLLFTKFVQCFAKMPFATPVPRRASAIKLAVPFKKMESVRNKHMHATSSKAARN